MRCLKVPKSSIFQLAKAHKVVYHDGVSELVKNTVYEVRSDRDQNVSYLITWLKGKGLNCVCEGFVNRGHCYHIGSVRIFRRSQK